LIGRWRRTVPGIKNSSREELKIRPPAKGAHLSAQAVDDIFAGDGMRAL
jgi:hypothetical protein